MLPRCVALISLMVLASIRGSAASAEADTEADEEVLRAAHLPTYGSGLLAVFRQRTPDAELRANIETWIAQLGSDSFALREEASEELAECGVAAAGLLRQATHHADLEIRRRARQALSVIELGDLSADVLIAALRVLAQRKPARMVEVLLDYAPYADSSNIMEELCLALSSAAVRDGKADPLLVRALTAKTSIQRGVAGAALCRAGCREQLAAARRLLRDPDAHVRRRVALALLEARDKMAVPVLIDLLAELPDVETEYLESILMQLAGGVSPQGSLDDNAARGKYRDAWADWWKRHGEKIDLAEVQLSLQWRGHVLIVFSGALGRRRGGTIGCVCEFDSRGKRRWEMKNLSFPIDAQVINDNRILVTEYSPGQVTERNIRGDILRRINVPGQPLEARRLPNGNTFIVTRNRIMEVDRAGKEVWKVWPMCTIVAACPLPHRQLAFCSITGEFVRMDHAGKILTEKDIARRFRPYGMHMHALANGHVLVPLYYENKVVECDASGRVVWSASYSRPTCTQRLPNGRTLVAGYGGNSFTELDKKGREVKTRPCSAPLTSVRGR